MKFVFLSLCLLQAFAANSVWAFPAKFSVSPDNSQQLMLEAVQSAQTSILLNVYMVTSMRLQQAIIDRLNAGVVVKLLIETEPFGSRIVPPQKKFMDGIAAAIKQKGNPQNRLFIMTSKNGTVTRRYGYDHAKYLVIDGVKSYVSSENFVNSGTMADPAKKGNRGWQVLLQDPSIAQQISAIFTEDTSSKAGDVIDYDPNFVKIIETPAPPSSGDNSRTITPFPSAQGDISAATVCTSPNAVPCITGFILRAQKTLDVEFLSLPLNWADKQSSSHTSPIVDAIVQSAKKGVSIRLLINKSSGNPEFNNGPDAGLAYNSDETRAYFEKIASEQHLSISVEIANLDNLQIYLVHNKGMVADGNKTWVSSINGTSKSVLENRELAVALDSVDAATFYSKVFEFDWAQSAN